MEIKEWREKEWLLTWQRDGARRTIGEWQEKYWKEKGLNEGLWEAFLRKNKQVWELEEKNRELELKLKELENDSE